MFFTLAFPNKVHYETKYKRLKSLYLLSGSVLGTGLQLSGAALA